MRFLLWLSIGFGCGLLLWLAQSSGLAAIGASIAAVGWGMIAVVLYHMAPLIMDSLAWRLTIPSLSGLSLSGFPPHKVRQKNEDSLLPEQGVPRLTFLRLIIFRWIRCAVNGMLPVAEIGGDVVGVRLLILDKIQGGLAAASIVVDRSLQIVSQISYTVFGVMILILMAGGMVYFPWVMGGVGVAVLGVSAFLLAQRWGLAKLLETGGRRLLASRGMIQGSFVLEGFHDQLMALYRRRRIVAGNFGWHSVAWLFNAGEIWLILWLMGMPISMAEAVVLHSLGQAARSVIFFMPAGLGVQEGSYIAMGAFLGLPPSVAIAVSLVRRGREIVFGLLGIIVWQVIEGRRIFRSSH